MARMAVNALVYLVYGAIAFVLTLLITDVRTVERGSRVYFVDASGLRITLFCEGNGFYRRAFVERRGKPRYEARFAGVMFLSEGKDGMHIHLCSPAGTRHNAGF